MNLQKTLLAVAMESGEVATPEPVMEYMPDANAEINEYHELVNSQIDDMGRAIAVTQSLEALAVRFEGQELTPESMENYHFSMAQILRISGANIPVAVLAPSFEAAEKDKTTIGQKVKGVVEALLKWVRERYAALVAMFKRWGAKLGFGEKKLDERNDEAKVDISKLKEAKIIEVGSAAEPVANEPKANAPAKAPEKPGSEKPAHWKGKTRGVRVPGWMVSNGHLNVAKVSEYIASLNGGLNGKLIAGNDASGKGVMPKDVAAFVDSDPFNKAFKEWKAKYPDSEYTKDYKATVGELENLIEQAHREAKTLYNECKSLEQMAARSEAEMTKIIAREKGEGSDQARISELRAEAAADLKYCQALGSFANSMRNNADAVHTLLTNMTKMAK